jgi:hypothetical protein
MTSSPRLTVRGIDTVCVAANTVSAETRLKGCAPATPALRDVAPDASVRDRSSDCEDSKYSLSEAVTARREGSVASRS